MLYYLLSQGTNSQEYSFILKNDEIIKPNDNLRDEILENFQRVDNKGKMISSENSDLMIKKFKSNYLIEVITINTDRLDRKIPVELLLMDYKEANHHETFDKINSILKAENILLDDNNWMSIPLQLRNCIKRFNKKRRIKLIIGISITIILFLIILILLHQNNENEKSLEEKNISFSNRSSNGWIDT